jgi:Flp pilus assembly pilin Flp
MDGFVSKIKGLLVEEEGQDIIEYALLAAFIAIVAAVILVNIGPLIEDIYTQVQEALEEA